MRNKDETEQRTVINSDTRTDRNPVITVDYERYQHILDDEDVSTEQKQEVLQIVWDLVCEFVALGFNVHPLDETPLKCGKPQIGPEKPTLICQDQLYSSSCNYSDKETALTAHAHDADAKGVAT